MLNWDMPSYSTSSAQRLLTCDHQLQALFTEVIKHADHSILCGHRLKAEQDEAFALGTSEHAWPDSKHNALPSRAVDVAPYPIDWHDLPRFMALSAIVKECAFRMGIKVKWGGDFKSWKDYPHWELID
jgi:hypothetical protein